MSTRAFRYGLFDPTDWGDDIAEHLFLQNKLWNRLVEIEREHRSRYRALLSEDDAVAPLVAQIEAAQAEKTRLREERKQRRLTARSKVPTPHLDEAILEQTAIERRVAQEIKVARRAAKATLAPRIHALNAWRFEAVKAARNASGLWWGNYNAVCASYETARSRALKDGGELQFHRFTGEGRFSCQLQGGATAVELITGLCSLVRVDPLPQAAYTHPSRGERRRLQRTRLAITAYTRDGVRRMLTFPMAMHRPIPADAIVKRVVVTRRKVGTKFQWHAVFTCAVAEASPVQHESLRACGVTFDTRDPSEGLPVALVASEDDQPLDRLELSADWLDRMDYVDSLQSRRDALLHRVHEAAKALTLEDAPEALRDRLERIQTAPRISADVLAGLVLRWREQGPSWNSEALAEFEAWRRSDKKMAETQGNLREKLLGARREQYRLWARDLATRFAVVAFGKVEQAPATKRSHGRPPASEAPAPRRNRPRTALHELRAELVSQCSKSGALLVEDGGPYATTCHQCGTDLANAGDDLHACPQCALAWHRDENAARNVLSFARSVLAEQQFWPGKKDTQ